MGIRQMQNRHSAICAAIAAALLGSMGVKAQSVSPSDTDNGLKAQVPAPGNAAPTPVATFGTIVVTANKRSERLQNVPMAVSVLPGSQLERESALNFADYASRVPGLSVISVLPGETQLVLRGITSGAGQPNATVGTYIDEAPYGSSTVYSAGSVLTPDIDPDDIQSIEVLRGPQGTLYGSNTLGGVVKFVSTQPDSTGFSARVKFDATSVSGGGSGFGTHAMVNIPLVTDKLSLRVNAYQRTDPGYIDNVFTGESDVNDAKISGARAQILWTPTEDTSLRLSVLAQNLSGDGLANTGVSIDPATLQPIYGYQKQSKAFGTGLSSVKYRLYDASLNVDFGWAKLISSTSYSTLDRNSNADVTAIYGPILNPIFDLSNGGYSLLYPIVLSKWSQELRLQSPAEQTLEWRVGMFYTRENSTAHQNLLVFDAITGAPIALPTLANISVGPAIFTEWAGFGDVTWHATPRLSILLGARYTSDDTSYTQTSTGLFIGDTHFTIGGSDHPVSLLVNPSFKFSDDLMAYARIASGFRPGGANVGVPPGVGVPLTFDPDKLVSYEVGLKSTMFDHRMSVNLAAFYLDWNHIQLLVSEGGFNFLSNGGKARSQGIEANWEYLSTSGLRLSANATWIDAALAEATPPGGVVGYKGDRLPYVSEWSANLGVDYDFSMSSGWSGFVGAGYQYIGSRDSDFNASPGPRIRLPGYNGIELRAGASHGDWSFKAYVKNLTNQHGIASVGPGTIDPTASPYNATYVPPRTVGVSISVDF